MSSSRESDRAAGWEHEGVGTFRALMPERRPRLSWFDPRLWWSSRQEVRARLGLGDISDGRRRAWVAPLTDDDLTVEAPAGTDGAYGFVVLCDTGEGDRSQYAVVPPLLSVARGAAGAGADPPVAFGVVAGDVVYPSGAAADYADKFFRPYRDLGVPVFGVPGNHDHHDGLRGFMQHVCGRTDPASRDRDDLVGPISNRVQRSPYFRIRTPLLTLVCIDTGLLGHLDAEQGAWLARVSADEGPKLLLSGKPLVVDGEVDPIPIEPGAGGFTSVWDVVNHRAHRYVATVAGDIHNYQHYRPAEPDGIHHLVSGGGGAFLHGTHTIPAVEHVADPRGGELGLTEDHTVLYPLRRDSLAAFSQVLDERLGGRGWARLEPGDAAAAIARRLGVPPVATRPAPVDPTRKSVAVDRVLSRLGGRWFQRFWSPFLDRDEPPFFKQFLRLDVSEQGLRIRCVAVDGTLAGEQAPAVEDEFTVPLARATSAPSVAVPVPSPKAAAGRRPAFEDSRPLAASVSDFPPGRDVVGYRRGDFVLVWEDEWNHRLIRFGQSWRVRGDDRRYVQWTHAAVIVSDDGMLVEAVGTGVQRVHLDSYRGFHTRLCRLDASEEDRDQVVAFAEQAYRARGPYGRFTIASIALITLTGCRFSFFVDGTYICSGLVARCLERTAAIFSRDPGHMTPADLAKYYDPEQGLVA